MNYLYHRTFVKNYDKLSSKKRVKVDEAISLFKQDTDSTAESLRNHKLKGFKEEIWSISAGGDLRIHY